MKSPVGPTKISQVTDLPYTHRPSHTLSLITARAWVRDDVLKADFLGISSYTTWRLTLENWADRRVEEHHLSAAALILELIRAGMYCRVYGTPEWAEKVAALWVRCHNEAGVLCENCR